jgi:hypothetical protein
LRRLVDHDHGHPGTFTTIEGPSRIGFDQASGARPWIAVLDVARPWQWEAATGCPLARRDELLRLVADEARRQVGGNRCE